MELTEEQLHEVRREIGAAISVLRDALAGEVDIFIAAETAKKISERALVILPAAPAQ